MGDFHLTSDEDIQYLITCEKKIYCSSQTACLFGSGYHAEI